MGVVVVGCYGVVTAVVPYIIEDKAHTIELRPGSLMVAPRARPELLSQILTRFLHTHLPAEAVPTYLNP